VTATAQPSQRAFYFVDDAFGALSVLAAGVARSLGLQAIAATSSPRTDVPGEIAKVLEEVGMRLPDGDAAPLDVAMSASDAEVVFLGAEPPLAFKGKPAWHVALHEGTGDLERMSAARMARDQIERRLELSQSAS